MLEPRAEASAAEVSLSSAEQAHRWLLGVAGVVTAGTVREFLVEPQDWSGPDFVGAAIVVGPFWLYAWLAKRRPHGMSGAALVTFLFWLALSFLVEPASITEGWIINLIVVGLLFKAHRAGLDHRDALRRQNAAPGSQPEAPEVHLRSQMLTAFFVVLGLASAAVVGVAAFLMLIPGEIFPTGGAGIPVAEAGYAVDGLSMAVAARFLVQLVAIWFFAAWLSESGEILVRLGRAPERFTPGRVVRPFFYPILRHFLPWPRLQALIEASDPPKTTSRRSRFPTTEFFGWWVSWSVATLSLPLAMLAWAFLGSTQDESYRFMLGTVFLGELVRLVAITLGLKFVRRVERGQAKWMAVEGGTELV